MTLAEMAAFVCGKVRARDDRAVADCKGYLAQRYQMLWEDQLWKDALRSYDFTFTPGAATSGDAAFQNYLCASAGVWNLPAAVDRMLALRKENGAVAVDDQFSFYRGGLDEFTAEGEPCKFFVLGQAAADLSGLLDGVAAEGVYTLADDPADVGSVLRIRYLDLDGEEQLLETELAGSGYAGPHYPSIILSVTKMATQGAVSLILDSDYVVRMTAAQTAAPRYLRLRLSPVPTEATALKALVKLKAQVLADDDDTPQLRGIENTLLAFAQGDMLERQRRYGQAQAKFQEGVALLEQLKRTEVMQEAVTTRIVPEVYEQSGGLPDGFFAAGGFY
jgi:hypothetical protein